MNEESYFKGGFYMGKKRVIFIGGGLFKLVWKGSDELVAKGVKVAFYFFFPCFLKLRVIAHFFSVMTSSHIQHQRIVYQHFYQELNLKPSMCALNAHVWKTLVVIHETVYFHL
jgi:hypothetical protein